MIKPYTLKQAKEILGPEVKIMKEVFYQEYRVSLVADKKWEKAFFTDCIEDAVSAGLLIKETHNRMKAIILDKPVD